METVGAIVYFASILGGLPAFFVLDALALFRLRGWTRLLPVAATLYIGGMLLVEFGPLALHGSEMDRSDFQRLLYERWSAVSRPALHAAAFVLAALLLHGLRRQR